jgi:hypothetical protein
MLTLQDPASAPATPPDSPRPGGVRQPNVLSVLQLIAPVALTNAQKCRVGGSADGGYVMAADPEAPSVCYSLGIGPDVSWDLAMAQRGAIVHQYDHTVAQAPLPHPRFRYARIGIAHDDSLRPDLRRLDTLIRQNGHAGQRDMVLKIDIEGHEWEALDALDASVFDQFRQIVGEFHGLRLLGLPAFQRRAESLFSKLRVYHEVIHIHGNNFAGLRDVDGLALPDCIEISFANRASYQFAPSRESFPGPLDAANNPALPDLSLGSFTFALTAAEPPPATDAPSLAAILEEPGTDPGSDLLAVPAYVLTAGQEDISRIAAMQQPVTPADNVYRLSPALLDDAIAACGQYAAAIRAAADAPAVEAEAAVSGRSGAAAKDEGLAAAIRHLRTRMADPDWRCLESGETARAVACVTGFLHFTRTWGHHILFPGMLASLAETGFSPHGLAPFAAAHCVATSGNPVSFPDRAGQTGRITSFSLATGPVSAVTVHVETIGRLASAAGQILDADSLKRTVEARVAAIQGRINARHPGILVLSASAVPPAGADGVLSAAVTRVLSNLGRKNSGLIAVAPIVIHLHPGQDKREVILGYGFMPIANPHFTGPGRSMGTPVTRL